MVMINLPQNNILPNDSKIPMFIIILSTLAAVTGVQFPDYVSN